MKLNRDFYLRPGLIVAQELIGKQLVHNSLEGTTKGIIVEAEAYIGPNDAARVRTSPGAMGGMTAAAGG